MLTYGVGKLTLPRTEFCSISDIKVGVVLLTDGTQAPFSISKASWTTQLFGLWTYLKFRELGGGRSASPLAGVLAVAPGNYCCLPAVSPPRLAPPLKAPSPTVELPLSCKNSASPLSGGTSGQRPPRLPEEEVSPPNAPSLVRIRWRHVRRSPPSAPRPGLLPPRHLPLTETAAS
ncbi:hypothetical protein HJG60_011691 [Phyllostomus discolor]|uniref:Uncharacterized protein n=1 Tax=Phyllostomus discolor TaxID=89673 RepID=A0A833ZU51_9CHIR|nr:hypothetical protein HJG60_011691 [Phyllostomus discolor]